MQKSTPIEDLSTLSVSERVLLVEDIWDSIVAMPGEVPLTDQQREELDERLASYRANPNLGSSWQAIRSRIK